MITILTGSTDAQDDNDVNNNMDEIADNVNGTKALVFIIACMLGWMAFIQYDEYTHSFGYVLGRIVEENKKTPDQLKAEELKKEKEEIAYKKLQFYADKCSKQLPWGATMGEMNICLEQYGIR